MHHSWEARHPSLLEINVKQEWGGSERRLRKPRGSGNFHSRCSEAFYCQHVCPLSGGPSITAFLGSWCAPWTLYLCDCCVTLPFPARLDLGGQEWECCSPQVLGNTCTSQSTRDPALWINTGKEGRQGWEKEGRLGGRRAWDRFVAKHDPFPLCQPGPGHVSVPLTCLSIIRNSEPQVILCT